MNMAVEGLMVGNTKATAVAAKLAIRDKKKKAREKKVAEAAVHKKLQESRLTEERSKIKARERGTIRSFLSSSQNVDNGSEL